MSKNSKTGTCNLCGVKKKLIKAHIYPKFLFNELYIGFNGLSRYPQKTHSGLYDPNILCAECDNNVIGKFDDFACKTLFYPKDTLEPAINEVEKGVYSLKNKADYRKIELFFISILWRASISSQTRCNISFLGTYQDYAKEAILNINFDYHKYFLITILHYHDLEDSWFHLYKEKIEGRNFYFLIIGIYRVLIKCDKQKMPADFPLNNYSTDKNILFIDRTFKNSPEEKCLSNGLKAIRAHISNRKNGSKVLKIFNLKQH